MLTPEQVALGSQAVDRSSIAALAFLAYDIMISVDEEVQVIWPRSWSFMKFNYFFIRYMPLLLQIPLLLVGSELSPQFHFTEYACFVWQISPVYAFYHDNRVVRGIASISFCLEIIIMAVGLKLSLPGITFDSNCVVTSAPTSLLLYVGASILFQSLLFGLTLYKFIVSLRAGWGHTSIVRLLMRDGPTSFLLVILLSNVSLYDLKNGKNSSYTGVLFGWILTLYSFCGYRILLNIGYLTHPSDMGSTTYRTRSTLSTSQFTNSNSRDNR
ncbi:hypothetical protein BDP27DRAFT_1420380 [Rhodocollybia butyracea]|uniref:DUF6533 domain-containing protein n=1 Tax=Rhodocollybia butyracea TaxID=206335 RepID=A0A9P5PY36_9AGAR|nr:hypothetical protein BDP27DRAFT_1420380 [Rhodocollybia butyracea]